MTALTVDRLDVCYGESQVLWQVSLAVETGEIVALVGANGAGKTTLLRTIAGLKAPESGRISLEERDITATTAEERVRLGIALVPEGRRLFAGMTALDNLRIGAYHRRDGAEVQRDLDRVFTHFPELAILRHRLAGTMSGGEQQMCAIGRALMSAPRLLLVDEMSLGLAPVIVERLAAALIQVNRETGTTILLVEQDIELALEIASRGYVIESGAVKASGASADLLALVDIREAYLGL